MCRVCKCIPLQLNIHLFTHDSGARQTTTMNGNWNDFTLKSVILMAAYLNTLQNILHTFCFPRLPAIVLDWKMSVFMFPRCVGTRTAVSRRSCQARGTSDLNTDKQKDVLITSTPATVSTFVEYWGEKTTTVPSLVSPVAMARGRRGSWESGHSVIGREA